MKLNHQQVEFGIETSVFQLRIKDDFLLSVRSCIRLDISRIIRSLPKSVKPKVVAEQDNPHGLKS